jgi:hypothetical protein
MVCRLKIAPKFQSILVSPEWTPLDPEANRRKIDDFIRTPWGETNLKDEMWALYRPDIEKAFTEKHITFSHAQVDLYNLGNKQTVYLLDTDDCEEGSPLKHMKTWRKRKTGPQKNQYAPEIINSLYRKYFEVGPGYVSGQLFLYNGATYSSLAIREYTPWSTPPYQLRLEINRSERWANQDSNELKLRTRNICTFLYKQPQEAQ